MNMRTVNIHEAKTQFSKLIARVEEGEEILIARDGTPVAKLVAPDISSDDFIGRLEGIVRVVGDIESPIEPLENWKVLR